MYRRASAAKSPVATPSPPRTTRRSARSGGAPSPSPARATRRLFLTILALSATLGAGVATAAFARPHLARARAVEAASIEASRALPHAVSAVGVSYDAGKEAGSGPLDPATHLVGTLFYPTPHASGVGRPPRSPLWSTWHYTRGYLAFGSRRGGGVGWGGRLVECVSATFFNTLLATVRLPVAGVALPPSPGPHLPVIFSHGLGGTRHAYSALCAGLAGRGFVVLSLEHADATAAVAKLAGDRGWLPYASWAGDAGTFARSAYRQVELDTAARLLEALASPGGSASLPGLCLEDLGGRPSPLPSLLSGTLARAPHIRPAVVGHSFGGAAAVQAAATGKWSAAVAVDPWYGALPADAPPFTTGLASPLLVLASHQWNIPNAKTGELSCGKARQDALFQAAAGKGAGLVHAVVGQTLHVDFGDVAALVGAAYPALAAKPSKKAMALQTGRLGLANDNGGSGLGTADAVAVVRLTARATADWLAKFMREEGGVVGQREGSALMGAAAKEGVQLVSVKVRAGS